MNLIFAPDLQFRIAYCDQSERNVLQVKEDKEWLCLHRDTIEEEQEEREICLLAFQEATLRGHPRKHKRGIKK